MSILVYPKIIWPKSLLKNVFCFVFVFVFFAEALSTKALGNTALGIVKDLLVSPDEDIFTVVLFLGMLSTEMCTYCVKV